MKFSIILALFSVTAIIAAPTADGEVQAATDDVSSDACPSFGCGFRGFCCGRGCCVRGKQLCIGGICITKFGGKEME
ncbi:hypothetical protein FPQ18DRAFT_406582 [Pyronema domesticum]|uniref:Uncharacterized protein n=1 Tax=Pyronema omphalodes (strain CBS 100304) TaxID=1076935 RepID=U4LAP6_PYROM|nr:hypothetical protein FPQ18DRAFT_406582 [Pyronema domesticum]CCX07234.1 Protein of unknown function [Pyronema omphalodes CBS 100304]